MTTTPMTAEALDEMRAKALWDHDTDRSDCPRWKNAGGNDRAWYRSQMRAIREADDAAGLAVVPDNDYAFMAQYIALPTHKKKAIRDFVETITAGAIRVK